MHCRSRPIRIGISESIAAYCSLLQRVAAYCDLLRPTAAEKLLLRALHAPIAAIAVRLLLQARAYSAAESLSELFRVAVRVYCGPPVAALLLRPVAA